jgi:hypothetical protein
MDSAALNQTYQTVCATARLLLRLAKDNPAKTMSITSILLTPILGSSWLIALPLKVLGFGAAGVGGGEFVHLLKPVVVDEVKY